ncbi:MAG: hypothetical protein EOP06_03795 [Proteobacteria bacterium]|nr:MAG: hypothetical protein EOP06_03795 [Pseudomonadota bacterium]
MKRDIAGVLWSGEVLTLAAAKKRFKKRCLETHAAKLFPLLEIALDHLHKYQLNAQIERFVEEFDYEMALDESVDEAVRELLEVMNNDADYENNVDPETVKYFLRAFGGKAKPELKEVEELLASVPLHYKDYYVLSGVHLDHKELAGMILTGLSQEPDADEIDSVVTDAIDDLFNKNRKTLNEQRKFTIPKLVSFLERECLESHDSSFIRSDMDRSLFLSRSNGKLEVTLDTAEGLEEEGVLGAVPLEGNYSVEDSDIPDSAEGFAELIIAIEAAERSTGIDLDGAQNSLQHAVDSWAKQSPTPGVRYRKISDALIDRGGEALSDHYSSKADWHKE